MKLATILAVAGTLGALVLLIAGHAAAAGLLVAASCLIELIYGAVTGKQRNE
ncbi:hypothetical protein ACFSF0_11125 [Ottowia flava]|uniref:Phosphatidate cytidylyltransferase n=1 Tax=Ottowia flava TaxID=2675430 RepID=A0ABW4KXW3_9BURK|nr:hypothetical protein [Ottowia sp. GY511]